VASEKDVYKWRYSDNWFPHFIDDWHRDVTSELSPSQEKLLLYILDKCKKKGFSYMSRDKIAEDTNIGVASVYRHLNVLYEKGWLKRAGFQYSVAKLMPTKKSEKHFFE